QRETLAMMFLNMHHQIELADMVFAGLWLIPFGVLVYRSQFLPRIIGAWLVVGSLPYIALPLAGFLRPGTEDKIFNYGPAVMFGEVAIMLWLLILAGRQRNDQALLPNHSKR